MKPKTKKSAAPKCSPEELDFVASLARRAKYLRLKIEARPDAGGKLYDAAECRALIWALGELGHPIELAELPAADRPVDSNLESPPRRDVAQSTRGRYFPPGTM